MLCSSSGDSTGMRPIVVKQQYTDESSSLMRRTSLQKATFSTSIFSNSDLISPSAAFSPCNSDLVTSMNSSASNCS